MTWKFITDPSVGMWSRAKRTGKGERLNEDVWSKLAGRSAEVSAAAASEDDEEELAYASDSEPRSGKQAAGKASAI